jgi:hypothetical protein
MWLSGYNLILSANFLKINALIFNISLFDDIIILINNILIILLYII